jgi:prepilin-type N-terminal cleavage/methylation domain-containing protein
MHTKNKGFTLIELLVVIAIIGILASVVLVSLQSARKKGNDARVKSNVKEMKTTIETGFAESVYKDLISSTDTNRFAAPPVVGSNLEMLVTDTIGQQQNGVYGADDAGLVVANGTVVITKDGKSPATGYAIYAKLPSDPTKVFCLDSKGNAKDDATFPDTEPGDDDLATTCQ